ncbi:uncharacterized protein [Nicotiana sylvestris]|uniref:uncharacterized protein n=1 Tax=Nicotiana sylvestris TaxID=4096 RepID=UPI00388CB073
MKSVIRFGKKGTLSPRYISPFEIHETVGEVAYKLALPPILSTIYLVFHVSMLRKYYGDPSHVLDFKSVQLNKDLTYIKDPVAILNRQARKLRSKNIASVKIPLREIELVADEFVRVDPIAEAQTPEGVYAGKPNPVAKKHKE